MKRFSLLTILAVLALLVCCILPTHAEAATSGDYTYSVSDGEATITSCSTSISGNVTIPSTLGGYPVTSIGSLAFTGCSSLTSITIPDSVTSIGEVAFAYCSRLTSITIPNSVTTIGYQTFYSCSSLTSITIPDSVTSIGEDAFFGCSSLTSITIPNSVTSIGKEAFYGCSSLTSVTIPDSVTSIGDSAFSHCGSLTSITIPNSVTSIGNSAFYFCSSLTSITIPNRVTRIGKQEFSYCSRLTSITIPNRVTSIGDNAFEGCSSLTSITIPNRVTSIGDNAFRHCSSLASITIPNRVTSIGNFAFEGCSSLNHVAYTGTENQWNSISIKIYNSRLMNATRHYETALKTIENCVVINIYCPACQKFVTSIAKPNGFHAFSAATCTAPKTCTACGVTDGAALGHSFEDDSCTVCGKKTVDLKIASVTLRPEAAGLYFTGSFEIAENVAVKRQGIVVSVYSSMPVADGSDPNSLWSAGTTSVMVKNILRANLKDTSNQNRAAMPIYARAYVELEDGTYVYSDVSAVNLQEVVEVADGQWNTLDAIQKEAFLAMYKKFQAILQAWSIPNVKKA